MKPDIRRKLVALLDRAIDRLTPEPDNADRLRSLPERENRRSPYGDANVPCGKTACVLGDGHYGKCDQ